MCLYDDDCIFEMLDQIYRTIGTLLRCRPGQETTAILPSPIPAEQCRSRNADGVGSVFGAEAIALRGVPSVQPIGDDGIAGILQLAARGNLRGA